MKTFKKLSAVLLSVIMVASAIFVPTVAEDTATAETMTRKISLLDFVEAEVGATANDTSSLPAGITGAARWDCGNGRTSVYAGTQEVVTVGNSKALKINFDVLGVANGNMYQSKGVYGLVFNIPTQYMPYVTAISAEIDNQATGELSYRFGVRNSSGAYGLVASGKRNVASGDTTITSALSSLNTYSSNWDAWNNGGATGKWDNTASQANRVILTLIGVASADGGTGYAILKDLTLDITVTQEQLDSIPVTKTINLLDMSSHEVGTFNGTYPTGVSTLTAWRQYENALYDGDINIAEGSEGRNVLQLDLSTATFNKTVKAVRITENNMSTVYKLKLDIPEALRPYVTKLSMNVDKQTTGGIVYELGFMNNTYYSRHGECNNYDIATDTTGIVNTTVTPGGLFVSSVYYSGGAWASTSGNHKWNEEGYDFTSAWLVLTAYGTSANEDGTAAVDGYINIEDISITVTAPASVFATEGVNDTGVITLEDVNTAAETDNTFSVSGVVNLAKESTGSIGSFDVVLPEGVTLESVTLGKGVIGFTKVIGNTVFISTNTVVGAVPFNLNLKATTALVNATVAVANDEFYDYEGNYGFDVTDTANVNLIIHEANTEAWANDSTYCWNTCLVEGCTEHQYNHGYHSTEVEITKEPTCTEGGRKVVTCVKCGHSYPLDIAKLEHSYSYTDNGDGTHTKTCSVGGEVVENEACVCENGACTLCGGVEHTATDVRVPDSDDGGKCYYKCSVEGCTVHKWSHGWHSDSTEILVHATCGTKGKKEITCSKCNRSYTLDIPATGEHTYDKYVDNGDGTHNLVCSVCDAVSIENEDHTTLNGECEKCGVVSTVTFNEKRSLKITEPWGIQFHGQAVVGESAIDNAKFSDYGFYVLPSYKAEGTVDAAAVIAQGKAFGKDACEIVDGYFVATYSDDIYTYMMGADIYYVEYVVIDGETLYSGMGTTSLAQTIDDRLAVINGDTQFAAEINILNAMKSVYEASVVYRGSEYTPVEDMTIPGIEAGRFDNITLNTEYKFGTNYAVKIVEPWGIQFRTRFVDSATMTTAALSDFVDYGFVIIKASNLDGEATVANIIADADAKLLSKSNGLAKQDGNTNYMMAIYDEDIFTYEMQDDYYFIRFFETEDGVVFESAAKTINVDTIIDKRLATIEKLDTAGECANEVTLLNALKVLYECTVEYRKLGE